MEQPMQPKKNGQAFHTMRIRFPESKTRVHPKDMASFTFTLLIRKGGNHRADIK